MQPPEGTTFRELNTKAVAREPAAPSIAVRAMDGGPSIADRQPMWLRPISATFARLLAPVYAVIMGSKAFFRPGPTAADELVLQVAGDFASANKDDRLDLQLGSSRPFRNLVRIWGRRGIGVGGKVIGTMLWPLSESIKGVSRADSYDPYAHSIALYHADPAILAHELGHAEDFARRTRRTLYAVARLLPPVALYQEWIASRNGIQNLRRRGMHASIRRANRVLGGGFGSYLVGFFSGGLGVLVGALAGQAIGFLVMPFGCPGRAEIGARDAS